MTSTRLLTRIFGFLCRWCPPCRYARSHPASLIGRILHHPLHADHCPLWKAERALAAEHADGGSRR